MHHAADKHHYAEAFNDDHDTEANDHDDDDDKHHDAHADDDIDISAETGDTASRYSSEHDCSDA